MAEMTDTATQPIDKAHLRGWFELPFFELLHRAHETHRRHFPGHRIQRSALLSIKTGGCSEDCGYCSQSHRHEGAKAKLDGLELLSVPEVLAAAEGVQLERVVDRAPEPVAETRIRRI